VARVRVEHPAPPAGVRMFDPRKVARHRRKVATHQYIRELSSQLGQANVSRKASRQPVAAEERRAEPGARLALGAQDALAEGLAVGAITHYSLELASRGAVRAGRRRAHIEALAMRLLLDPPGEKTLVIACATPEYAEALARDLKAAVARLTKGRT